MGTSTRPESAFISKTQKITPGPGNYSAVSDFDIQRKQKGTGNGFKFGRDGKLKHNKSNTPGPGYYYIPCSIVDVPRYHEGKWETKYRYV